MNFNLNPAKLFNLLKLNFKGILKYTFAIMFSCLLFIGIAFLSIILYKTPSLHISVPIILSLLSAILLCVAVIYFTGLNYEMIHNFIDEKDEFMPIAKGRCKEFLAKGVKVVFGSILYFFILLAVFLGIFIPLGKIAIVDFMPFDLLQFITLIVMVLGFLVVTPFFMAYAHTFKFKSLFDKINFKIFWYACPEFIYSYALSQIFMYVTTIIFMLVFIFALLIAGIIIFGISLIGNALLTGITASLLICALILAGVFISFLINTIVMLFAYSLNAQSYNYGKYFFYKNEAPKRTTLEILVPILVLMFLCCANIYTDKVNDSVRVLIKQKTPDITQFIYKFSK